MICTWLTEMYLDALNQQRDALVDDVYEDLCSEFVDFLSVYRNDLDRQTTFELISSHGRTADLLQYAEIVGDHDWVLRYTLEQGRYLDAVQLIRSLNVADSILPLVYQLAPQLVEHEPNATIDVFIDLSDRFDGIRLLPALHRCEAPIGSAPALRYLRHIVEHGNREPVLHNYMVSLLVQLDDETDVLQYLRDHGEDAVFDQKFALRLCHQYGRLRACVRLYELMGLYHEAVRLALHVDLDLAKSVCSRPGMLPASFC